MKTLFRLLILIALCTATYYGYNMYSKGGDITPNSAEVEKDQSKDSVESAFKKMREKGGKTFKAKKNLRLQPEDSRNFEAQVRELDEISSELIVRNKQCEQETETVFPNDNLIDVNDKFYEKPHWVIEKLHDTFSKVLNRKVSQEGYGLLESMVSSNANLEPKNIYDRVKSFNICRPQKALTFLDTAAEAFKSKSYNDKIRQEMVYIYTGMLRRQLKNYYSTENMTSVLGQLGMITERGLIPSEAKEEIADIFKRLRGQEKVFRTSFQQANDRDANYSALKDDFSKKREIGLELEEILTRFQQKYAPSFE